MKKLILILLSSLCVNVAAYANLECPSYALPYPVVCDPCRTNYAVVEALCWKAREDGMAWAASQTGSFDVLTVSPTTAEPNWKWEPGFRVGLGHRFCNNWDVSLTYTWYRSNASDTETFDTTNAVAFGLFDTTSSAGGNASWSLHYDTLDLALKYPFYIGKTVILVPTLSLFGAYTSDNYNIHNIIPSNTLPLTSNDVLNNQKLYCIGPKIGLNSVWQLNNCWSIFGEGSIACLWGHYDVTRLDTHTDGAGVTTTTANLKNNFDTIRLVPTYSLGVCWSKPICNYCVDFKLAWEQQVWLEHNQFFMLSVSNDNTLTFNNTNLSLYGITASLGVTF